MAGNRKISFEKVLEKVKRMEKTHGVVMTHRGVKFEPGTSVAEILDFVKYLITDLCREAGATDEEVEYVKKLFSTADI